METTGFLNDLLKSARDLTGEISERGQALSGRIESEGIAGLRLGRLGQGALAGGALALLLGRRSGRRLAKWGSLAALGTLTYRAWRDHQSRAGQQDGVPLPMAVVEPRTVDRLPAPEIEQHSRAILVAVVAAARSDGHVDERERGLIHQEVARMSEDAELRAFIDDELERPLDPARVAAAAQTPEMAAEMYLASLLLLDPPDPGERAYLEELAGQLRLDPDLKASLERQLDGAG